jgi:LacI family transcriptional regulator
MPSKPLQRSRRRVALIVETSRAYGRGVLRGISQFVRQTPWWSVRLQDRGLNDPLPEWLTRSQLDGIIARVETPELADALKQLRRPVINLSAMSTDEYFPTIDTDDEQVAELAFEHFADRGFRNLAFCGYSGAKWSDTRHRRFAALAREAGINCDEFVPRRRRAPSRKPQTLALEMSGLIHDQELAAWLQRLPRTTGVFAANDLRGRQLLGLCSDHNLIVPDHLSVLGVDNDGLLCELTDPPLSSIEPDCERIGLSAAAALDSMMTRPRRRPADQFIAPAGIATRKSTDVLAINEPLIVRAVRYIREHACEGIGVPDVLRQVPLSRSKLERGFTRHLGRPPKAEILRIQLERARELLRETDMPLPEVSSLCGFRHPEYFNALFRQKNGMPPGRFRRQNK